jgi:serine/threonine-protein kinase RsbW
MEIGSEPTEIHTVEEELEKFCHAVGLKEDDIENFGIATTEMVNNAIRHGNNQQSDKKVYVTFEKQPAKMIVTVQDSGTGFIPEEVADPLAPENILKDSGRGIFIVKTLMDEVRFNITDQGTKVVLIKNI